jgi:5'-nucleotidase
VTAVHIRFGTVAVTCVLLLFLPSSGGIDAQTPPGFTVLLGNDDGFEAPGLQALIAVFGGTVDLYVAAPAQNQSGKGHGIAIGEPLIVRERKVQNVSRAYSVESTPVMALRLGIERVVPGRPDLVISGINRGENIGTSVYPSGTVGAAREAVISGIPAIAVSMAGNRSEDYAATAAFTKRLVDDLRARKMLKPGFFLNVNAPAGASKGAKVVRLSVKGRNWQFDCTTFVRDRAACFSDSRRATADEPDTDVQAFNDGYITITPLSFDTTDFAAMGDLRVLEQVAAQAVR